MTNLNPMKNDSPAIEQINSKAIPKLIRFGNLLGMGIVMIICGALLSYKSTIISEPLFQSSELIQRDLKTFEICIHKPKGLIKGNQISIKTPIYILRKRESNWKLFMDPHLVENTKRTIRISGKIENLKDYSRSIKDDILKVRIIQEERPFLP